MVIRHAQAVWEGNITDGDGLMETESGAFKGAYTFKSRYRAAEPKTNPEELLGAAHAGCFSMALADALTKAGYGESRIYTYAAVTLDEDSDPARIACIDLETEVHPPTIPDDTFLEYVEIAKEECLVSQALAAIDINVTVEQVDEWSHF